MGEEVVSPADQIAEALANTTDDSGGEGGGNIPAAIIEAPPVEPINNGGGGHPAWTEILSQVPEVLHPNLRPVLEKWDQGVIERLNKVQQEYAPVKDFLGQNPEDLRAGMELVRILNTDPKSFYEHLGQTYGYGTGSQGQQEPNAQEIDLGDVEDLSQHPQFQQLMQQSQVTVKQLDELRQAQEAKEASEWLTGRQQEITTKLAGSNIEPDWDYILSAAQQHAQRNGNDFDKALDSATEAYVTKLNALRTPVANQSAPPVMAPNGAVPAAQQFDPNQLPDAKRREYTASLLAQALKDL